MLKKYQVVMDRKSLVDGVYVNNGTVSMCIRPLSAQQVALIDGDFTTSNYGYSESNIDISDRLVYNNKIYYAKTHQNYEGTSIAHYRYILELADEAETPVDNSDNFSNDYML